MAVTVRYFGAARAAAGTESELVPLPAAATVGDLLTLVAERHGAELAHVLRRCSYLLDEIAVTDLAGRRPLDGSTLDVLPPFAGG